MVHAQNSYRPRGFSQHPECNWTLDLSHPYLINPRRACAARVTVIVCVCVSTLILVLQATRWPMSDTNGFGTTGT